MKYFKGKIADKKISDFNQYDNTLTKFKDRIAFVEGNMYEEGFVHEFFSTYFSQYYTVSPSQDGYLAEEDSVCKLLEILGTYILSANDVESNRKIEYKFWKSEREYNDYKDSSNVGIIGTDEEGREVEVIDMFVDKKNDKNQKIVKSISVSKQDLKDIFELRQLQDAIDYMKSPKGVKDMKNHVQKLLDSDCGSEEEREKLKYISKNTERYIAKYAKSLSDNQVLIKKAIKRPIEFKNLLKDEGVPHKLDALDFMESNDVEALLPFISQEDLMTDIGVMVFDLLKLITVTKLSNRELEIIKMLKNGYKQIEIAEELGIKKQNVKTYMKRISEKVSKSYEKQVESYRDEVRQKKVN